MSVAQTRLGFREAARTFRRESERHSGMNANTRPVCRKETPAASVREPSSKEHDLSPNDFNNLRTLAQAAFGGSIQLGEIVFLSR
jgi:hypothetical protein